MPSVVLRLEVTDLPVAIELPPPYECAFLVLFWRGRPVGDAWIAGTDGHITGQTLREIVASRCDAVVAECRARELVGWNEDDQGDASLPCSATIAVCTRDRVDDLGRCLTALAALPDDGQEIIVVDSASVDPDAVRAVVARHPRARYVREDRGGLDVARNRAMREARGEIVAFCDDDAAVDPGWLRALRRGFADARTLCVTGLTHPLELETPAQEWFERTNGFGRGYRRAVFDGVERSPFHVAGAGAGANMALRRSALDLIGPFDEALDAGTPTRSGGDHDMFSRILAAGYRIVYEPRALSWHRHRRDWKGLRDTARGYGTGAYAFFTRHLLRGEPGVLRVAGSWFVGQTRSLARALFRRPGSMPLILQLEELRGCAEGPLAYLRSRRRLAPHLRTGAVSTLDPATAVAATAPVAKSAADVTHARDDGPGPYLEPDFPNLSVIIPTHRRPESLLRLLRALRDGTLPPDRYEVIVVADGGESGSIPDLAAEGFPFALRVLEQRPRAGAAASRNLGAAVATGSVLLFIDDDIEPLPSTLLSHGRAHADGAPRALVGAPIPISPDSDDLHQIAMWGWWEQQFERLREPGARRSYHDVYSGILSMPATLFAAARGFDTAFETCRDDAELGLRLLRLGTEIGFSREAGGRHHELRDLAQLLHRKRAEGRADVLLARRHPELWPSLPLSMPVTRWSAPGLVARLAFHAPAVGDQFLETGLGVLRALERLRLRQSWRLVHGGIVYYSYWRGAAEALGEWRWFAALASASSDSATRTPVRDVRIDLSSGVEAAVLQVEAERPDAVSLWYGDQPIGGVRAVAGAEPVRGAHLRRELAAALAAPSARELVDTWRAAGSRPVRQPHSPSPHQTAASR